MDKWSEMMVTIFGIAVVGFFMWHIFSDVSGRIVRGEGLYNGDMGFVRAADRYGVTFETDDGRVKGCIDGTW